MTFAELQSPNQSDRIDFDRSRAIQTIRDGLRPGQREMANWQGGLLAVSAVPGSGKSKGMAAGVAIAIARHGLNARHQIAVVTFTRSAAANIKIKIRKDLETLRLPPWGFFVSTLHGLALRIATHHRELSGLDFEGFSIAQVNQSHRLLRQCVEQWIASSPSRYRRLLEGCNFDGEEAERLRRQSILRTDVLPSLANTVIHEAKSSGLTPDELLELSRSVADEYGILDIAAYLYREYDRQLRAKKTIDYDDTILAALRVLENESARKLWQERIFGVFEDEAQDSSPLQTQLLEILASNAEGNAPPNLVRVGDPNQAINSTFTPADPVYFRRFCHRCDDMGRLATIDRAGRSSQIIMDAANFALDWVNDRWLAGKWGESSNDADDRPFKPQHVRSVAADDPQLNANPEPVDGGLELDRPSNVEDTVDRIGQRVLQLFEDSDLSAAVLVRTNHQGRFVSETLRRIYGERIPIYDVGERERLSAVPAELLTLLKFLDRPHSPDYLKAVLRVFVERKLIPPQDLDALAILPEQFLYPTPLEPLQTPEVQQAQKFCCNLLQARLALPQTHLIPFLTMTLQYGGTELATADKIAERVLRDTVDRMSLPAYIEVLSEIANAERFEPVEAEPSDKAESKYTKAGQLTVMTMHKAKGLDWDVVFVPFLHADLIPGNLRVRPQTQFLGEFALDEVARAQIRQYLWHRGEDTASFEPFDSPLQYWKMAKRLKIAEEFRLLYVAMTRAKRLLWMSAAQEAPFTWSKIGNFQKKEACPVFAALEERFF
ncbi:MAG: ATP-dependent helicase [Cyanobacteria bacterium SID2]|nr:ATP-dependent helicase [Cyanobacteria bacterium SID2]MBP0002956.1 ATP-dependent helicase [Cyanobacteria bacterium SBC]